MIKYFSGNPTWEQICSIIIRIEKCDFKWFHWKDNKGYFCIDIWWHKGVHVQFVQWCWRATSIVLSCIIDHVLLSFHCIHILPSVIYRCLRTFAMFHNARRRPLLEHSTSQLRIYFYYDTNMLFGGLNMVSRHETGTLVACAQRS